MKPKIYIASLSDYNAGTLHGVWIDAAQDIEDISEEINKLLVNSPTAKLYGEVAEEWAIHDYEDFAGIKLSEYQSLKTVSELAKLLAQHGTAYGAYANYVGLDYATQEDFLEKYQGAYTNEEDFVEERFRESNQVPEYLEHYIDWVRMARDWFLDGYYSIQESYGCMHIFASY